MKLRYSRIWWWVVPVVAAMIWWVWPVKPETLIKRELHQLAELGSFGPDEVPLQKIQALGHIKKVFHPDVTLKLNFQGRGPISRQGRDLLMESLQIVRFNVPFLRAEFLDPMVQVSSEGDRANVTTVFKVKLGEESEQFQELNLTWEPVDGRWRIRTIETVKTWGR